MEDIIEEYLQYLEEFGMPSAGIMPARSPAGYKQALPPPVRKTPEEKEEEEEEVEEYTTYNPHGSGYGMMLQRWSFAKGDSNSINTLGAHPSQKTVKDIEIDVKTDKKKKKGKDDEEDTD